MVHVWDAMTGEYLREIHGYTDPAAVAAGAERFPWLALVRIKETLVEDAATGECVAWFPEMLRSIIVHPSGRAWVGGVGMYLCLLRLEGCEST